ncbi:hypothetical protein JOB18_013009 [Solea senegalensis]|uniref:Uncharacterized protein n=1 Tax=Solea senegalensis TaxID=28829 RepID=A0AAV6QT73_SOLSE|nr:hypothetical protein JOB18_013009 [Solea senegalensis]
MLEKFKKLPLILDRTLLWRTSPGFLPSSFTFNWFTKPLSKMCQLQPAFDIKHF